MGGTIRTKGYKRGRFLEVPFVLLPPFSTADLLKLIRLYSGINQVELARRLEVTQSWLSRLESGMGDITLNQLLLLKKNFGVSADQMVDGAVSFLDIASRFKVPIALPSKYSSSPGMKMVNIYPFLRMLIENSGEKAVVRLMRSLGVARHLLAEPKLPIHVNLMLDVMSQCHENGLLNYASGWNRLGKLALVDQSWKAEEISKSIESSPIVALKRYFALNQNYDRDFTYSLIEEGRSSAQVSLKRSIELLNVGLPNSSSGQWICRYKQAVLREVAEACLGKTVKLKQLSCQFHKGQAETKPGRDCIFHVSWAI